MPGIDPDRRGPLHLPKPLAGPVGGRVHLRRAGHRCLAALWPGRCPDPHRQCPLELPSGIVTLHSPAGDVFFHRASKALGA